MITLLLMFMLGADSGQTLIAATDVYQPLRYDEVAVTDNGEILVLNYNDAVIKRYNKDGKLVGPIGFKGQGPGGLIHPWNMFLQGNKLYVVDRGNDTVTIFSLNGDPVKIAYQPQRGLEVVKVNNGWAYGDWAFTFEPGSPAKARLVDDFFEEPVELIALPERGVSNGLNVNTVNGKPTAIWTPVGYTPIMCASKDGKKVFVAEANDFKIHVFSTATKKEVQLINKSFKRIPFDKEWGESGRLKHQKGRPYKIEANYHDYFPIIRYFLVTAEGYLAFNLWRGNPDKNDYLVLLDESGKDVKRADITWELCERMVAVKDGQAYITTYDDVNETSGISKVPRAKALEFLKANPVKFEGRPTRTVNRGQ